MTQRPEGPVQAEGSTAMPATAGKNQVEIRSTMAPIASLGEPRLLHQLHQPGERAIRPHGIDPHDQITVEIESPAQDPPPVP